jgi:hypothetical protein
MKIHLPLSILLAFGMTAAAQHIPSREGAACLSAIKTQKFANGPLKMNNPSMIRPKPANLKNGNNANTVNVITLGSDVTAYNCGYNNWDHKTMLWADDTLKAITYIHGMGPLTPDGFLTAHIGMDLGRNMGKTAADWTLNTQIYAANMGAFPNGSLPDEVLMIQGAMYSPPGNTSLDNAYLAFFAMNNSSNFIEGGYSHGAANLVNPSDSSKSLYWYNPPPYSYLPQGFTITQKGIAFMTDMSVEQLGGAYYYRDEVIAGRGIWNNTLKGFDYTLSTLPLATTDSEYPYSARVAASPDGNTVWIVILANTGVATQIGPFKNYYPVLFKSTDAGLTWGDAITVQLDGPNGIAGVKQYLSNSMIRQLFSPPYPSRDEIGYSTAFECDLNVDKWGNPHIGVDISVPFMDYHINAVDSSFCVFDIYSTDDGLSWSGVAMGYPQTFRGTFGTMFEDNRVHIASTETGDKMFVTWNDTQIPGVTDNSYPDVFARGFDLVTNKITSSGGNQPNNVTMLSDISQEAFFQSTSHYVFTGNNKYTVPIVTEFMSEPSNMNIPVTFKYIPDFSYTDADFTIPVTNAGFPTGIDHPEKDLTSVTIFPNPVKDFAQVSVMLNQGAKVSIEATNMVGQTVILLNKGTVPSGAHKFTLDAGNLPSGVYLVTVYVNQQRSSTKMMVE